LQTDWRTYAEKELASRLRPKTDNPFTDCWDFLSRACWTKDEATGKIVQFPSDERHQYLRYITEVRPQHPIFAVEKSRRMMATWLFVCIYLYDTLTQRNHANFWVSKKLGDAAYVLGEERLQGVYNRIPADVWPNKPEMLFSGKEGKGHRIVSCPSTGSSLEAVASGADQLRQYTASNIMFDEFAFQERQYEAWTAAKPTAEGGGHIDLVSTAEQGAYMYELLHDEGA
jgi:phage FluMu gp28-like protein